MEHRQQRPSVLNHGPIPPFARGRPPPKPASKTAPRWEKPAIKAHVFSPRTGPFFSMDFFGATILVLNCFPSRSSKKQILSETSTHTFDTIIRDPAAFKTSPSLQHTASSNDARCTIFRSDCPKDFLGNLPLCFEILVCMRRRRGVFFRIGGDGTAWHGMGEEYLYTFNVRSRYVVRSTI